MKEMKRKIRVVTYNLFGFRMLRRYSVDDFAAALKKIKPDVIALQEVDEGRFFPHKTSPVQSLASKLSMELAYHPIHKPKELERSYGNAVLSRLPLKKIKEGLLPGRKLGSAVEARGVIWAEIQFHDRWIQMLNTHISFLHYQQRRQMKNLTREWIQPARPDFYPLIVTGDFNMGPSSRFFDELPGWMMQATGHLRLLTWPSQKPWRQLDYIMVNPFFDVIRCFIPHDKRFRRLSDHLPVVADLSLRHYPAFSSGISKS